MLSFSHLILALSNVFSSSSFPFPFLPPLPIHPQTRIFSLSHSFFSLFLPPLPIHLQTHIFFLISSNFLPSSLLHPIYLFYTSLIPIFAFVSPYSTRIFSLPSHLSHFPLLFSRSPYLPPLNIKHSPHLFFFLFPSPFFCINTLIFLIISPSFLPSSLIHPIYLF